MGKLTKEQVEAILALKDSGRTLQSIADEFRVSPTAIYNIFTGKRKPISPEERTLKSFWAHVKQGENDQCWLWEGCVAKFGYGSFKDNCGSHVAHRYVLELQGMNLDNKVVRHSCDNPRCVNPKHLLVGTHADNVQDRVARKRSACGTKNGRSKLTVEQVREIRKSNESGKKLACLYNVDPKTICGIRNGKIWKSVK